MNTRYELFDGDVIIPIEQEAVHLKAVSPYGEPVELTPAMYRDIAEKVLELSRSID